MATTRKPNSSDRLKKIQLALYLDADQLEALRVLSAHRRVTQQEYLREGLMEVLKTHGVKKREQKMPEQKTYIVGADTLTDPELASFDAAIHAARSSVNELKLAFIRSEPLRGSDGKLCEVRVYEGLLRGVKAIVPILPNGRPGKVKVP